MYQPASLCQALGLVALFALVACGDSEPEAEVYEAPAEPRDVPQQVAPATPTLPGGMAGASLAPDALASATANPAWAAPEGWAVQDPGSVRRASFTAAEGSVDISVTAFPGAVGGLLANVNRWRQQVGLAPVGQARLRTLTTEVEVDGQAAHLVTLTGEDRAIVGAIVPRASVSWFVKAMGPVEATQAQAEAVEAFVTTWSFGDNAG